MLDYKSSKIENLEVQQERGENLDWILKQCSSSDSLLRLIYQDLDLSLDLKKLLAHKTPNF